MKENMCAVTNRSSGMVIYNVPEMHVRRVFYTGETKEVDVAELEALVNQPGGRELIYGYLLIKDPAIAKRLMNIDLNNEVEYNMSEEQVKSWINSCTLDEFKDALDFAPAGVKDLMKKFAVEVPLNDVAKREAMKEQIGFDVDAAINIKREAETPEKGEAKPEPTPTTRRAEGASTQRRVKTINQKETTSKEG